MTMDEVNLVYKVKTMATETTGLKRRQPTARFKTRLNRLLGSKQELNRLLGSKQELNLVGQNFYF